MTYPTDCAAMTETPVGAEITAGCRCLITRYLGNQAVECVQCGKDYPDGVPARAIMLNHDCEICRRNVAEWKCEDIASIQPKYWQDVDALRDTASHDRQQADRSKEEERGND